MRLSLFWLLLTALHVLPSLFLYSVQREGELLSGRLHATSGSPSAQVDGSTILFSEKDIKIRNHIRE